MWHITKEQLHKDAMQVDKMSVPTFFSGEDVVMNLMNPDYRACNYFEEGRPIDIEPNSLFCL